VPIVVRNLWVVGALSKPHSPGRDFGPLGLAPSLNSFPFSLMLWDLTKTVVRLMLIVVMSSEHCEVV